MKRLVAEVGFVERSDGIASVAPRHHTRQSHSRLPSPTALGSAYSLLCAVITHEVRITFRLRNTSLQKRKQSNGLLSFLCCLDKIDATTRKSIKSRGLHLFGRFHVHPYFNNDRYSSESPNKTVFEQFSFTSLNL